MCSASIIKQEEAAPLAAAEQEEPAPVVVPDANNNIKAEEEQEQHNTIHLKTCTPTALANYLIAHRFGRGDGNKNDASDKVVPFLQAAVKAAQSVIVAPTPTPSANDSSQTISQSKETNLGSRLLSQPLETSLLTPRAGKFHIQLHEKGLLATQLKNPNIQLSLPQGSVSHMVLFAKPEDCKLVKENNSKKAPNAPLVLLRLDPPVMFQNKSIDQVCFATSWTKGVGPTGPAVLLNTTTTTTNSEDSSTDGWKAAMDGWRQVLTQSLGNTMVVAQVHPGKSSPFQSHETPDQSTTTGGMPFVKCYHGVQDGVLYPLEEGLLFYKPPKFLPRSQLHSIKCGRGSGGGQNASRYVDLVLQLAAAVETKKDTSMVEFTNIQRDELGVLNQYIQGVLIPAMKRDVVAQEEEEEEKNGKHNTVEAENDSHQEEETEEEASSNTEEEEDDDEEEESDEEDENFVEAEEEDDEEESESEDDDDDDDEFEVVQDEFAKELVKRKKAGGEESSTESEQDDDSAIPRASKRRRRRS